jgi:hypothetical protein
MQSAKIGPGSQGGMSRLALSASDKDMRDLFVRCCKDAGCAVSIDKMGSMFARRPGSDDSLPPVLIGSHLDTQIHGGPFDGCAGVLAGLELLRTLNDHGIQTKRPIEFVDWSNEEGARFAPSMMASAVFAGVTPLSWVNISARVVGNPVIHGVSRELLVSAVAWHLQARQHGGLNPAVQRKLERLAAAIDRGVPVRAPTASQRLRPGMSLERAWRGETHSVTVLEDGFAYRGQRYRSLSQIARRITGTHWNGLAFFGLRQSNGKASVGSDVAA